jgi:hypothetical protein
MIIYFYDLKTKLKDYNRIKRMFYYDLKKSGLSVFSKKTKSVIIIEDEKYEPLADRFFQKHSRYVEAYKAYCTQLDQIF